MQVEPKNSFGKSMDPLKVCTKFQVSRTSLSQKNLTNRKSRRNGHDKSRGSNLISNSSQTNVALGWQNYSESSTTQGYRHFRGYVIRKTRDISRIQHVGMWNIRTIQQLISKLAGSVSLRVSARVARLDHPAVPTPPRSPLA